MAMLLYLCEGKFNFKHASLNSILSETPSAGAFFLATSSFLYLQGSMVPFVALVFVYLCDGIRIRYR